MGKLEVEAMDKKAGMTLDELKQAVERFFAVAQMNESDPSVAKIKVFVNFSAGIKSISAEV